eukprot:TRINITY_DN3967_c0_g1_i1.p1 TRINITY_DN3967_c0_g1~~TRINITY_DN3967_c0_g1_i1.p1  ORF type:complete len:111 (-),score=11.05 TRINITY_DN3967_c0_g1_i1:97-429(-)
MDLIPFTSNFSFGTIVGVCAGYATKKISRLAAYYIGCAFVLLQVLQYNGYITISWEKVNDDIQKRLDQDGDGKFDTKDAQTLWSRFMKILQSGLPSGLGIGVGLYYGLKW